MPLLSINLSAAGQVIAIGDISAKCQSAGMETARVNIVYRPVRIAFAIHSNDLEGFRNCVKQCHCLWGGRYNPIVLADRPEAPKLMELFRPDILTMIGQHTEFEHLKSANPALRKSAIPTKLFYPPFSDQEGASSLLDVRNMIAYQETDASWKAMIADGVKVAKWNEADPLSDVFMMQFGQYPSPATIGIDYLSSLYHATQATDLLIENGATIPVEALRHANISHLSRYDVTPHYSSQARWSHPGFYFGNSSDIEDLVAFWNLRACGIQLMWQDLKYPDRTALIAAEFESELRSTLAERDQFHNRPAIWHREINFDHAKTIAGEGPWQYCGINESLWNGHNLIPAKMHFGEETALAVLSGANKVPRLRFELKEKPFAAQPWFHRQHLVASISVIGGPDNGAGHTFSPPFLPELNKFVSRTMLTGIEDLRLEPGGIGIIINARDVDLTLGALSVADLIEQTFKIAGFEAKFSSSGLIARQLITSMGGVDGVRAFKIPGVRQLIKSFGPTKSFSRKDAINKIGSKDPITGSSFGQHRQLFIEKRSPNTDLNPSMVFTHLVEKGLFRIGSDLVCPTCQLTSWTPLDSLKQKAECQLCGTEFDATRQLVEGSFAYRRSGVLGVERNAAGAIPVAMVLQQLHANFHGLFNSDFYSASYDLRPIDPADGLPVCETDIVALLRESSSSKLALLIGECKDAGGTIDAKDINHLRAVADAFPRQRIATYILLAKLSPFTEEEIQLAMSLNTIHVHRVILLTHDELEPYHFYERHTDSAGEKLWAFSARDLAEITHQRYFKHAETATS